MASQPSLSDLRCYDVLPDGTEVIVRELRERDRALLTQGFDEVGADARYQRFLTPKAELSDAELSFLTHSDERHHALAIVTWDADGRERPLGVAHYVRSTREPTVAEPAITIVDVMQRRGLGKLLLERLSSAAYERGVRRFRWLALGDNIAVQRLMRSLPSSPRLLSREPGAANYELDLPAAVRPACRSSGARHAERPFVVSP
jgi:GNAT superfamily N-acetyltransferase